MKTVYIAEKPDIATAMAAYLWKDYKSCKNSHAYAQWDGKDDTIITWAYGHILMTAMPQAYGKEFENFNQYPIMPQTWKKLPSPRTEEQLDYIRMTLKNADVVVNAGDPDREGQLLIDEILEYVGYKGTVKRILINAKDNISLKRAFDNIVDNSSYLPLYHAGLARERADWLVGMNLSRAYTVNAKKNGNGNVWRVGRVKVPTLALVVQREKEIRNFKPVTYYILEGRYQKKGISFKSVLAPDDTAPTDSEGRITDKNYIDSVYKAVKNRPAEIVKCERKTQSENAPLPFSLDTLQVEANKRHGFSPSLVLEKVQSLYEKKLVSYPRSDCNYIPTSQHSDGIRILKVLQEICFDEAAAADASIKGRCFNDSKVTAHHALIPTGVKPDNLDGNEQILYNMIAQRYILQFYQPCIYDTVSYEIQAEGYQFVGSGKSITSPGWKAAIKDSNKQDQDENVTLPPIAKGDVFDFPVYLIDEKKTTPPKRFTEGTLLAAMTNIWRFVSKDNPNKELLKECKGLGTPATRDSIISDLISSTSGKAKISPCLQKKGKELIPTPFGESMIECIHESLTKPDMTAVMEYNLSSIAEGKMSLDDFMAQTEQMVQNNIQYAEQSSERLSATSERPPEATIPNVKCPICGKDSVARKYSPKLKKYFWICEDKNCVHPFTGKPVFYDEVRKKAQIKTCPQCALPLKHIYSTKTKEYYWFCEKCNEFKKMSK